MALVRTATRSTKNMLVCLYGATGSFWNRHGNVCFRGTRRKH